MLKKTGNEGRAIRIANAAVGDDTELFDAVVIADMLYGDGIDDSDIELDDAWGPEAWEASAEARRRGAGEKVRMKQAYERLARAEAWARKYNAKKGGGKSLKNMGRYEHLGEHFGFGFGRGGDSLDADVASHLHSLDFDATDLAVEPRYRCSECDGARFVHGRKCPSCNGTGFIPETERMRRESAFNEGGGGKSKKDAENELAALLDQSKVSPGDISGTDLVMYDAIDLDDAAEVRFTDNGYMVARPRIARSGIQLYSGDECGRPDLPVVRVLRPEDQVFHADAMRSYAHRPITLDHPLEDVTSENWKKYAVGQSGDDVTRDGHTVRVPMVLMDKNAIDAYKKGTKQLSVGYGCDLCWGHGVTDSGEEYDAIQRHIRANHIAVVASARGGSQLSIGDNGPAKGEHTMQVRTIVVDGLECQMSDSAALIVQRTIDNLNKKLADYEDKFKKFQKQGEEEEEEDKKEKDAAAVREAQHADALKTKDAEIVTLKKQLEDSKLTPQKLDGYVRDRTTVIMKAEALLGQQLTTDGKTTEDLRREVVMHAVGDIAKNWGDSEIAAAFSTLQIPSFSSNRDAQVRRLNPIDEARTAFGMPGPGYMTMADARERAYADYDRHLLNAHRGNGGVIPDSAHGDQQARWTR